MGPGRGWHIPSPLGFLTVLGGSPAMWGPCRTPIWCIPVYNKWKVRLKTWASRWSATEWVKRSTWENHESPKNSFTWSLVLSIKWPINSAKQLSSRLLDPLLINWHEGQQVPYPYYRIKTEKCTYKASAAIELRRGKPGKMTIPHGATGYCLYAAAANQEAGIKSHDMRHHCKQLWRTVDQIHLFLPTFPSGTKVSRWAKTFNC